MRSQKAGFEPFAQRMAAAGLPDVVVRGFQRYYAQLAAGHTGVISEADISPVTALPDLETLPTRLAASGRTALSKAVMIKLNGGLGTGMGLDKAKSLLTVKDGLTFLDIVARQALTSGVPLVLMDSYNTRDDSLALLERYPELQGRVPLDFVQHKVPKVSRADLAPVAWPAEPALEWCPPGHGDIYIALVTSGMLDTLLGNGYEVAFVSNADNLGAVLDPLILGYFVTQHLPFLMEVADRTIADRKGGHVALRNQDGRLTLRESAQCDARDLDAFQDIARHRYFNTNNLWISLPALQQLLARNDGIIDLPMIRNIKTTDPRDPATPEVYQLETAMGAAIALFQDAGALRVPRKRFAPVKTCSDLLAVRSDAYVLDPNWQVLLAASRPPDPPIIDLDPRFYQLIDDLDARFPFGPPSLLNCKRLRIRGDVKFGRNITCQGVVEVMNTGDAQAVIADHMILENRNSIGC